MIIQDTTKVDVVHLITQGSPSVVSHEDHGRVNLVIPHEVGEDQTRRPPRLRLLRPVPRQLAPVG